MTDTPLGLSVDVLVEDQQSLKWTEQILDALSVPNGQYAEHRSIANRNDVFFTASHYLAEYP